MGTDEEEIHSFALGSPFGEPKAKEQRRVLSVPISVIRGFFLLCG
jgi:hypothetical protein